jgi:hypothetical protein
VQAAAFFDIWWALTCLHRLAARDVLIVLFGDLDDGNSVKKGVSSHYIQPFD